MKTEYIRTQDRVEIFTGFTPCASAAAEPRLIVVSPGYAQNHNTCSMQAVVHGLAGLSDVLILDYRGTGNSTGWYHYGAREHLDLGAVLQQVRPRYARIWVLGFSLGAYAALRTAMEYPGLCERLFLVSCPPSLEAVAKSGSAWLNPIRTLFRRTRYRFQPGSQYFFRGGWPFHAKPDLAKTKKRLLLPCHFLVGTRDTLVCSRLSRRVYEALEAPKTWDAVRGGLHAEHMFLQAPEQCLEWITSRGQPA